MIDKPLTFVGLYAITTFIGAFVVTDLYIQPRFCAVVFMGLIVGAWGSLASVCMWLGLPRAPDDPRPWVLPRAKIHLKSRRDRL